MHYVLKGTPVIRLNFAYNRKKNDCYEIRGGCFVINNTRFF